MVISGPLKTLGSFMSFHTCRSFVEPRYASSENFADHQSRTGFDTTSRYADDPGQHQPSKSVPSG